MSGATVNFSIFFFFFFSLLALNHLYLFLDDKCGELPTCPAGKVCKQDKCVCDTDNGFITDTNEPEKCVCDTVNGFETDTNNSDKCVKKGRKNCITSLKYSNTKCLVEQLNFSFSISFLISTCIKSSLPVFR